MMYRNHTLALGPASPGIDLSRAIGAPVSQVSTVVDVLCERAASSPHQTAFFVIESSTSAMEISNEALLKSASELAARLYAKGVRRGDIVLLALETSADLVSVLFGCIIAGFIPSVLEAPAMGAALPDWAKRLTERAWHVKAKLVLTKPEFCELLADEGITATSIQNLPDAEAFDRIRTLHTDPVFLQFTSGTTSRPKALLVKHEALLANVRGLAKSSGWTHEDTIVSWLPLYHDMGLVAMTLAGLTAGMPVVLMPSNLFTMNPTRWLWAIDTFKGTITAAPNFAYQFVAAHAPEHRTRGLDLSTWRQALNAAEFVQQSTIEKFTSRFEQHGFSRDVFTPAYGLAECTVAVSIKRPQAPVSFDMISRRSLAEKGVAVPIEASSSDALSVVCVGPAINQHQIRIVDENGNVLPDRTQGQICVKGPSVVGGYYEPDSGAGNRAEWLETGDLGYLHEGQLFITGRIKDLIIRAGSNISPYEIEHTVADIEGVRSGAVGAIGLSDLLKGTENIVVFFETTQKDPSLVDRTKQAIRDKLVQKLNIAVDHVLDVSPHTLQKTTSGKLQRTKLVTLAQQMI